MNIDYNSPLHIQWNVDEEGNLTTEEILNEQIVVSENKAYLKQIPEKYYRISVAGMVEVDIDEEIKVENKFKCDYRTGALYFHHTKEGQTITVEKYNGRGVIMYPSSRIYSKIENGVVTETLESLIDSSNNKIQEFSDAEDQRELNEAARISQETSRTIAETDRITAESIRTNAETNRVGSETDRVTAESERQSAENLRVTAENTRVADESSRLIAESDRVNAEDSRIIAENNRESAETDRTNAEDNRVTAENSRVSAEHARTTTETSRANAETNRENAELLREQHMKVIPKENVSTYADIATTYPNPETGWLVNTIDTNKWWRYDGSTWINVATYSSDALNSLIANLETQYSTPQTTQQSITSFDSDTKDA
ncbi:MAG: hypothetical protein MJA31_14920, partial [Clostridia bacterium]|nr:hypothetical protein [Clostridia bacterium]